MTPPSLRERFLANERVSAVVCAGLLVPMMTCAATITAQAAQRLAPGWQGDYLTLSAAVVALEAVISVRVVQRLKLSSWGLVAYRLAEFILILAAIKLLIYSRAGWGSLLADLPRWQQDWSTFFGGEYLFAGLLLGGIWLLSWLMADTLLELEGDIVLLEREALLESNRIAVRHRLATQIFGVGAGLVVLTALGQGDLRVVGLYAPPSPANLFNVVAYFALGLMLFSLGHLAVLRAIWSMERIEVGQNLAARWAVYAVAMVVGVGLLASLLPTRYSLGLLSTLSYVVSAVMLVFYSVLLLVIALGGLLMGWLSRLLPLPASDAPPTPPVMLTVPPSAPLPGLEALKSILFWAVFLGVLGYSLYYYGSRQKEVAVFLRQLPFWRWLVQGWRAVWGGVGAMNRQLAAAVQEGLRRLRGGNATAPWRYVSLRRLSPAERVRFFYLALVRRGGERGWPRRPSETPYEYESDLNASIPEAGDDVAALTDAFVEARYSPHPVTAQAAEVARRRWEQLRKRLNPRRGRF